ncbi:putative 3-demethylubiquinone-9 3-methyltransferase (glyoxalase superfamily) [Psychrobacillus insolitus]|jgi:predicted 3-demethylubiquinone-9 3-methyltransferase (glyoxalase superfamily)|uniref:Putative 3-demethylubiquinone-9 3-methyltransferase (Glyoxalase superfamily) n=1 Tax=Psychrobacillus insolitus TaxID=1461 RepID=A0A2W7N2D6_9BACI|nr:VOC family protein [Psychrobacillus insolitus]PZX02386.1 putative 3-demethylubiquinone-9 3-methyltransferase (glyoxalase superfamily) [Psychrobacillus insolitus]
MEKVTSFLMFQDDNAEEAMNYYTSLIEDSQITSVVRYGSNESGKEGTVMQATFTLKGQEFMCIDSNVKHQFSFTPSFSIFVTCDTEEELDNLYHKLIEGGQALMPLGDYGFSKKFGWINDRFGVSWQLNLPK